MYLQQFSLLLRAPCLSCFSVECPTCDACESTFRRIALDPRGPNCIFSKLVWKPLMKCTFGKREHSSDMFGKAFIVLSLSVVPLDGFVVPQGSQRLQSTGGPIAWLCVKPPLRGLSSFLLESLKHELVKILLSHIIRTAAVPVLW